MIDRALALLAWLLAQWQLARNLAKQRDDCWRTDHHGHAHILDHTDGRSHNCGLCGLAWTDTD